MKNVLVICTGNSCRSIMAEALINQLGEGRFHAASAGSTPTGFIHPKSIDTLRRHGINPGQPKSQSWDEFVNKKLDIVITVCDQAANEPCPNFSGSVKKLHWSTPDPAKAEGSEEDILQAFDQAFMLLKKRIETELL